MASNTNPFLTAHYEKTALTEQTAKRIQRIYKQSAQDIEKKLRNLKMLNPSDSLKKVYLENLLKDINKSSDSFNRLIQSTITSAGEQAGSIAVDAGNKIMKLAGLEIKGAYSYIPRQQVLNIASGKLYGDKWTLSQSIWKNGIRTKSDIQNVVAKGLTENKSIKAISDDLIKYVDPTARKPWDWSKVYPGTATKVDYNAQRLARTMIQHSFQSSLVQSQRYNPFCKGVIWHSVGLHGRTCELCMERDGNVFPLKDLPLDHPNGLCYFEPALDAMNDIADRLGDWVNGGSDPALDTYVAKAFNLSPKSTTGKRVVNTVKESAAKKAARKVHPVDKLKTVDDVEKLAQKQGWFSTKNSYGGKFDYNKKVSFKGMDLKSAQETFKAHEKFFAEFPEMRGKFINTNTFHKEGQEFGHCAWGRGRGGVGLNTYWFGDYEHMQKECIRLAKNGWSPAGTDAMSTVYHELSHAMDDYLSHWLHVQDKSEDLSRELRPLIARRCGVKVPEMKTHVSRYATTDASEWFAEAMSEALNSENPREVAQELIKEVKEIIKKNKELIEEDMRVFK